MVMSRSSVCFLGVACLVQHAVELVFGEPMGHFWYMPQTQILCWWL